MPYPNEHALRLKAPGLFDKDSFRRTAGGTLYGGALKVPGTISMIWGKLQGSAKASDPVILQALRFKKSWSVVKAKAWIKKNIKQTGKFEPASTATATEQSDNYDPSEDVIWGDDEQYDGGTEMSEADLIFEEADGETAEAEAQAEAQAQERQLMDGETADEEIDSTESGEEDPDTSDYADQEDDDEDDQTYTVEGVELFATGTHNGDKYSTTDLDQMVANFTLLRKTIKPPFILGHGDQTLLRASGLPAAGWVIRLRRIGAKLIADIADAPKAVYNLIKKKAYKRISVEIYQNYQDSKGKRHGLTLARVAMLGGDIPAVKTLKDIEALYAENALDNEIRTVTYTMPETKETLDKEKDIETEETEEAPETEKTEKKEEEEEAAPETEETETEEAPPATVDMAEYDAKLLSVEKKYGLIVKAQDTKIASLEAKAEARDEEIAVVKDGVLIDKLTEAGTFPPALREKSLLLMSELRKDDGILKYNEIVDDKPVEMQSTAYAMFANILETLPTMINMSETGTGENTQPGSGGRSSSGDDKRYKHVEGHDVKDVEIADAADKYYEEHKAEGITYSDALIAAQKREV